MNRLKRQTMIKRLVTENEIHTQSELLALLEKRKYSHHASNYFS